MYKYRFIEDLAVPLGKVLIQAMLNSQIPIPDLIIPVPLHKRRLRWRGFNQAELLANYLGENLAPGFEIPVFSGLLVRKKYTHPQMEIKNYFRRKKNIENAFQINEVFPPTVCKSCDRKKYKLSKNTKVDINCYSNLCQPSKNLLKGKTVLLVDDIATTGATIFECAKTLKQNGAKYIFAVVIARQEYSRN